MRLAVMLLLLSIPSGALAVPCPDTEPGWMHMRFEVYEPNLDPPANRGMGEIFAYAYERGESTAGTRFIAVSDMFGDACIEDITPGDWVVTVFEPFVFRPIVREISCTATECDLGVVRLDTALRVSDDFVSFGSDWFGGPFAQTVTIPDDAVSVAKITFRDGAMGDVPIDIYEGRSASGTPLGRTAIRIDRGGGRDTALFAPGALTVVGGQTITMVGNAGWAPWRVAGDPYAGGSMFTVSDGSLTAIDGVDMAFNLDLDGVDGQLTNHLALGTDGAVDASEIAQGFVARSSSITHASVFVGPPDGLRRMRAFISATPDGAPIGPVKETQGLQQQGVAFAWAEDEVPVTPGETYYLRVQFPEGSYVVYTRARDAAGTPLEPAGMLTEDGNPVEGLVWGRILGPMPTATPDVDGGVSPDAGTPLVDAGVAMDGSSERDAGPAEPPMDGGCGCRVTSGARGGALPFVLLGLFAMVRRRA